MTFDEKKKELEAIIYGNLLPLIDNDYILLDLPYHSNIGDVLIWEGELTFLKNVPYSCMHRSSMHTYYKKQAISKEKIVLIHGGGNFGDVWRDTQLFHLEIIRNYPENKIIVFPQTVHYNDLDNLKHDAAIANAHKNLTICARDERSYRLLKEYYYNNEILLVPDMAFCIPKQYLSSLAPSHPHKQKEVLFFKRTDKELTDFDIHKYIEDYDIGDWPTRERGSLVPVFLRFLLSRYTVFLPKDYLADKILRKWIVRKGVRFLTGYKEIYTTRLHGAILSVLLNIPFYLVNNSYGKNKEFFNTWLKDLDKGRFLSE